MSWTVESLSLAQLTQLELDFTEPTQLNSAVKLDGNDTTVYGVIDQQGKLSIIQKTAENTENIQLFNNLVNETGLTFSAIHATHQPEILAIDQQGYLHSFSWEANQFHWQRSFSKLNLLVKRLSSTQLAQLIANNWGDTDLPNMANILQLTSQTKGAGKNFSQLWQRLKDHEFNITLPGKLPDASVTNKIVAGEVPWPVAASKQLATSLSAYIRAHLLQLNRQKPISKHSIPRPFKNGAYFIQHHIRGRKGLTPIYKAINQLQADLNTLMTVTSPKDTNLLIGQLTSGWQPENYRLNTEQIEQVNLLLAEVNQTTSRNLTRLAKKIGLLSSQGEYNPHFSAKKYQGLVAKLNIATTSRNLVEQWHRYWQQTHPTNNSTDVQNTQQLLTHFNNTQVFLRQPVTKLPYQRRDISDSTGLLNAEINLATVTHGKLLQLLKQLRNRQLTQTEFSHQLTKLSSELQAHPVRQAVAQGFASIDRLEAVYDAIKFFSKALHNDHHPITVVANKAFGKDENKLANLPELLTLLQQLSPGESLGLERNYSIGFGTRVSVSGIPDGLDPIPAIGSGMDRRYQMRVDKTEQGYKFVFGRDSTVPLFLGYSRGLDHDLAELNHGWGLELRLPSLHGVILFRAQRSNECAIEINQDQLTTFFQQFTQKQVNPLSLLKLGEQVEIKRGRKAAVDVEAGVGAGIRLANDQILPDHNNALSQLFRVRARTKFMVNLLSASKEWSSKYNSKGEQKYSHSANKPQVINSASAEVGAGVVGRLGSNPEPVGAGGIGKAGVEIEAAVENKVSKQYEWTIKPAEQVTEVELRELTLRLLSVKDKWLDSVYLRQLQIILDEGEPSSKTWLQLLNDTVSTPFNRALSPSEQAIKSDIVELTHRQQLFEQGLSQIAKVGFSKNYSNLNRLDQPSFWRQLMPNHRSHVYQLQQLVERDSELKQLFSAIKRSEATELKVTFELTDRARAQVQQLTLDELTKTSIAVSQGRYYNQLEALLSEQSNYRIKAIEVAAATRTGTGFGIFVGIRYKSTAFLGLKRQLGKLTFNYNSGQLEGYKLEGDIKSFSDILIKNKAQSLQSKWSQLKNSKIIDDLSTTSILPMDVDPNLTNYLGQQRLPKLTRFAYHTSRFNMGLQLAQLPGSIYQVMSATQAGETLTAVKGGVAIGVDHLDLTFDIIANSHRIQQLSSRLAVTASRLGAGTSFIGAGFSAWHAVESFQQASRLEGDEKIDAIVAGSIAVASTLVAIATGIASLVLASAGPIGVAIGLALAVAQGIYTAVRTTQQLRQAGISEADLWRAGAAVFFGFPVPVDIQNQAIKNQVNKAYQQQMDQQLAQFAQFGIDKLVYSEGHVQTTYGRLAIKQVVGRHDYYGLTTSQQQYYWSNVPDKLTGRVFGHQPKPALVKQLPTITNEGTTLFMLGSGYDAAQGDQFRRNIFRITGWGRKHLFGGQQADIFELNGWRHGVGNKNNGRSQFFGGDGEDTLSIRNYYLFNVDSRSSTGFSINLADGVGYAPGTNYFELKGIEHVLGSSKTDTLTGDNHHNTLTGFAGDDKIVGQQGNDRLAGGAGSDQLTGGRGSDSYIIQLADFVEAESDEDTINNFDDFYQKNWQEYYQSYYQHGLTLKESGISYLEDDDLAILESQATHHADYQVKYANQQNNAALSGPAEDILVTDIHHLVMMRDNDDLLIQVERGWLSWQLFWQRAAILLKEHQKSDSLVSAMEQLIIQFFTRHSLGVSVTELVNQIGEEKGPAFISSGLGQTIWAECQNRETSVPTIARVNQYFKGRAWQHLTIMDLQGHQYLLAINEKQRKVNLNTVIIAATKDNSGYKVLLNKQQIVSQANNSKPTTLLSNNVLNVVGSAGNDWLQGNAKSNWLIGGKGFDQLIGGDGDDLLNAGDDGGRMQGGNGADIYQVAGNQGRIIINNEATDRSLDTLMLVNGFNNLLVEAKENYLLLHYQHTQIKIRHWFKNKTYQHLAVQITNQSQQAAGTSYGILTAEGNLALNYLRLTSEGVSYQVDLTQYQYQWQQANATSTLSSMGAVNLYQHFNHTLVVQLGDNNDHIKLQGELVYLTGGNGVDTITVTNQLETLVLDNYATDLQMDRLLWQNLDLSKLALARSEDDLVLFDRLTNDQSIIVKDWQQSKDKQHLLIEDQQGQVQNIAELIQAMGGFSELNTVSTTVDSNFRVGVDNKDFDIHAVT
ncbi:AvrE-family type 3 secretion system effector [Spartinivicinus ruber]|uniref:AvrE-family type 3 secretion system effector n=1 Tax=Spartinivicinus ruber TaxID=2683272 RepID=UPI0013D3574A|nr:AvrE-family type 3 secretion system effector [Spartinivicinus ruber]